MTDADALPELYPRYCFHLSPTLDRFCHLRIADIVALTTHPGFRGQDIFFYINHPIKWVRIAGVVVAIDEFEGKRVYTVDDSSGFTVECVANTPLPPKPGNGDREHPLPVTDGEIDVGHVLDVKGSIRMFRDGKQVRADKISHLRSTAQEVQFWDKLVKLRDETLARPWVLSSRELRRCRKEAGVLDVGRGNEMGKAKKKSSSSSTTRAGVRTDVASLVPSAASTSTHHLERERELRHSRTKTDRIAMPPPPRPPKVKQTGLERRAKGTKRVVPIASGEYDALGL